MSSANVPEVHSLKQGDHQVVQGEEEKTEHDAEYAEETDEDNSAQQSKQESTSAVPQNTKRLAVTGTRKHQTQKQASENMALPVTKEELVSNPLALLEQGVNHLRSEQLNVHNETQQQFHGPHLLSDCLARLSCCYLFECCDCFSCQTKTLGVTTITNDMFDDNKYLKQPVEVKLVAVRKCVTSCHIWLWRVLSTCWVVVFIILYATCRENYCVQAFLYSETADEITIISFYILALAAGLYCFSLGFCCPLAEWGVCVHPKMKIIQQMQASLKGTRMPVFGSFWGFELTYSFTTILYYVCSLSEGSRRFRPSSFTGDMGMNQASNVITRSAILAICFGLVMILLIHGYKFTLRDAWDYQGRKKFWAASMALAAIENSLGFVSFVPDSFAYSISVLLMLMRLIGFMVQVLCFYPVVIADSQFTRETKSNVVLMKPFLMPETLPVNISAHEEQIEKQPLVKEVQTQGLSKIISPQRLTLAESLALRETNAIRVTLKKPEKSFTHVHRMFLIILAGIFLGLMTNELVQAIRGDLQNSKAFELDNPATFMLLIPCCCCCCALGGFSWFKKRPHGFFVTDVSLYETPTADDFTSGMKFLEAVDFITDLGSSITIFSSASNEIKSLIIISLSSSILINILSSVASKVYSKPNNSSEKQNPLSRSVIVFSGLALTGIEDLIMIPLNVLFLLEFGDDLVDIIPVFLSLAVGGALLLTRIWVTMEFICWAKPVFSGDLRTLKEFQDEELDHWNRKRKVQGREEQRSEAVLSGDRDVTIEQIELSI